MKILVFLSCVLFFLQINQSSIAHSLNNGEILSTEIIITDNFDYSSSLGIDIKFSKKKYLKLGKRLIKNPFYKSDAEGEKSRAAAIIIDIFTGPLGGHRLYLGTSPVVPVVYAVTLGGGIGLLPIIDLIVLSFSKDFYKYVNNPKVVMWIE